MVSGTLHGAHRTGDILPHDHHADISFILRTQSFNAYSELTKSGIKANGLLAVFRNATADFVRWIPAKTTTSGKTEVMLDKFYPASSRDNFVLKYHHTLETFPQSWNSNNNDNDNDNSNNNNSSNNKLYLDCVFSIISELNKEFPAI